MTLGEKKGDDTATNLFYLITTHNPRNLPIREIVTKNWELLQKTKTTRDIHDNKIIFGLRCNKNLSDQLVRASTCTDNAHITHAFIHTCNRPQKCRYCPKINTQDLQSQKPLVENFYTMVNVNCQSSNLIYLITCKHCSVQYVGQTKNRLLTIIFQGHQFDIQNQNDTTVS